MSEIPHVRLRRHDGREDRDVDLRGDSADRLTTLQLDRRPYGDGHVPQGDPPAVPGWPRSRGCRWLAVCAPPLRRPAGRLNCPWAGAALVLALANEAPDTARLIMLTGTSAGCGKSTAMQALAERYRSLGREVMDIDASTAEDRRGGKPPCDLPARRSQPSAAARAGSERGGVIQPSRR
jgi:hypothetical protein